MIGLSVTPQVLLWGNDAITLRQRIELEYEALLHEALHLAYRSRAEGGGGRVSRCESLDALVGSDLSADLVRQVLRAPRTVRRLLWPRPRDTTRTQRYLKRAFAVERALCGLEVLENFSGWTADCRAYVSADGKIVSQPLVGGCIPIDMKSPHARTLDLLGGSRLARPARSAPSPQVAKRSIMRGEQAWKGICSNGGSAADCVAAWTRILVAQSEGSGKFWSGTNGQYIGRVVLANMDGTQVSVEEVADAIVHEAIHGFLYMHECLEPWVQDYSLYTDEGAITSPWSGNLLPVRPFIQACFVWYGLAMFWAQHLGGNVFDRKQTHYLLGRALAGFRRDPLADLLKPWQRDIRKEIIEIVEELQQTVRSLLA